MVPRSARYVKKSVAGCLLAALDESVELLALPSVVLQTVYVVVIDR